MLGQPKYKRGDKVQVDLQANEPAKIGIIAIVDAYGSWEVSDEPSYDILLMESNEPFLCKHVGEQYISLLDEARHKELQDLAAVLMRWMKLN